MSAITTVEQILNKHSHCPSYQAKTVCFELSKHYWHAHLYLIGTDSVGIAKQWTFRNAEGGGGGWGGGGGGDPCGIAQ